MKKIQITKKRLLYIGLMLLFVLYLLVINHIIVHFNRSLNYIERISELPDGKGNPVLLSLSELSGKGDNLDSITISGSAACETLIDNPNKYIDLILQGKNNSYRVRTTLSPSTTNQMFLSDKIKGVTNSFIATFPTLTLKNDVYSLILYVWENEENSGFVDLRSRWVKTSRGMKEYVSGEVEPVLPADYGGISFMPIYDQWRLENDYYTISGFAVKLGCDSAQSDVYVNLCFEDGSVRTYETNLFPHPWYKSYLESEQYAFSRFTAKIPQKSVLGKTAKLEILVDNDGVSAAKEAPMIRFTEDGIEEICTEALEEPLEIGTGRIVHANGGVSGRLNCFRFSGTAYLDGGMTDIPDMFVEIRRSDGSSAIYPAAIDESSWMRENIGEKYAMSNYDVKISKEDIGQEDVELYLLIRDEEVTYRQEEPLCFTWQDGTLIQKQ